MTKSLTSPEENGCNAIEIQSIMYRSKIVKIVELISYSTYALITASTLCLEKHTLYRKKPKVHPQKLIVHWLQVLSRRIAVFDIPT